MNRIRFVLRQVLYDLRVGLLVRPASVTVGLSTLAVVLVWLERHVPAFAEVGRRADVVFDGDASSAQVVLGTVAGSMMTVVSIVYSVLLMTLSLTSVQFSPRVLTNFVKDRTSQTTLGAFVGTFVYCLLVLGTVRGGPDPFVPVMAIGGGVLAALGSMALLLYFIHHIARGIQVNYIVEAIAWETEQLIDALFPHPWEPAPAREQEEGEGVEVAALSSGYVQMVDDVGLEELARAHGLFVRSLRKIGQFAIEGAPLAVVSPRARVTEAIAREVAESFDLGPVRTMQQDVELGVRQLVDIALKALSPAVNDPSTAATCLDQLTRLLARLARRRVVGPGGSDGTRRVEILGASLTSVIDLAFNQIRQCARADMAVSVRLLRALDDVASVTRDPEALERLELHGRLVRSTCEASFAAEDCAQLHERHARLCATLARARADAGAVVARAEPV